MLHIFSWSIAFTKHACLQKEVNETKANARTIRKLGTDDGALTLTLPVIVGFVLAVVIFGSLISVALQQLDGARTFGATNHSDPTDSNATRLGVAGLFSVVAIVAIIIFIAILAKSAE